MSSTLQSFQSFLDKVISVVQHDAEAIGLAVGGSWASGEMDAYSDLDLVLVTNQLIAPDLKQMRAYAARLGTILASFRGDHVGEPRLLIALYDAPLLHVDIKFLTLSEFYQRVEDPIILWERDGQLTTVVRQSTAHFPGIDYQGIEDRFWVWVHYAALKIGRGEYFEALDFLTFVRGAVLGPLLHLKRSGLPRGVRRLEATLEPDDLDNLRNTVATPDRNALLDCLLAVMCLYNELRDALAPGSLQRNNDAQLAVTTYVAALQTEAAPIE